MKDQKIFLPRELAKMPTLDSFQPGEEGGGGGAPVSPFDSANFIMIHDANGGAEVSYTELHMDSKPDGGSKPIKDEDDPKRVMLIMGIPKVGDSWTMSVKLNSSDTSDEVVMTSIENNYAHLRATLPPAGIPHHEVADVFFTIPKSDKWETYVNINQPDEVLKLSHSDANSFDACCMSFLALSNV